MTDRMPFDFGQSVGDMHLHMVSSGSHAFGMNAGEPFEILKTLAREMARTVNELIIQTSSAGVPDFRLIKIEDNKRGWIVGIDENYIEGERLLILYKYDDRFYLNYLTPPKNCDYFKKQ